jgi:uncharacterized protein (TIRG00374 family)
VLRWALALSITAAIAYFLDWSQALRDLSLIPIGVFVALVAALAAGQVLSAWRWQRTLRMHDLQFPFGFLLRTLSLGFFLNSFLPTAVGGDAYRVYCTLPRNGQPSRALSAVVVERAAGLLILLALGALGALTMFTRSAPARLFFVGLTIASVAGTVIVIALERGWFRRGTAKWQRLRVVDAIHHNIGLLRHRGREWMSIFSASLLFQCISIGVVFTLFSVLGSQATFAQCALITAVVGVSTLIPFTINGIGVVEGALVGTAVVLGLDYEHAVIVAIVRRLAAMSLAAVCGAYTVLAPGSPFWRWSSKSAPPSTAKVPLAAAAAKTRAGVNPLQTGLLESTHDAVIIWEMSGRGIIYWNHAAEQLYGFTSAEARGKTTHALLRTEPVDGVDALESQLARFGMWVGELHHTSRNGDPVCVEARLTLMSQSTGRWLVLEVNRDISDRKRAEADSRAMQRQLGQLRELQASQLKRIQPGGR